MEWTDADIAQKRKEYADSGDKKGAAQFETSIAKYKETGVFDGQVQAPQDASGRIQSDINTGKAIGQDFLPNGSLGRLSNPGSAGMEDIINKRKAAANDPSMQNRINELGNGFNNEELQSYRDTAKRQIDRQTQGSNRQLLASQANNGVSGASAVAQQMQVQQKGVEQRADFERNLFMQQRQAIMEDENQKMNLRNEISSRVNSLESSYQTQAANEATVQKFNLDQAARERFGQLSTALGFAGLGVTERTGVQAADAAKAAGNIGSGGGKK